MDRATILGIWIEQTEGAKFWMKVFTDLKTRGCQDILIAVTDGLKGMSEALAAVFFPATTLQTCIVHLIRHSLAFGNWKERKHVAAALRPIYTAPSAELASAALDAFEQQPVGDQISHSGRRVASRLDPRHPLLCLSAGDPPPALHDQCAGSYRPCAAPQDHQNARVTFQMTRPRPNCCGSPCGTLRRNGNGPKVRLVPQAMNQFAIL